MSAALGSRDLSTIIDAMPGGVALVDACGAVFASNRESWLCGGQDLRSAVEAAAGGKVLSIDGEPGAADALHRRLGCEGAAFELQLGARWYQVRTSLLPDQVRVVGSIDVTAHKQRALELEEARAAAELASRYKTEFLATMSHELRNPLTSIIGSLGVILGNPGGALPAKVERLIGIALNNSRRLVGLINEILDVEKIESGIASFDFRPVKFADAVREAITVMNGAAAQRQVTLAFDANGCDSVVRADAERLTQAAINLLSNAIKFSPEGGVVGVTLSRAGERVRLTVSDRGPGIAPAFRSRIFQRFAQADKTKAEGGSGLGLAIARSIVVHFGGEISFETAEGVGTTFHVDLPVQQTQTNEAAA